MSIKVVGHVRVNDDQPVALALYLDVVRHLFQRFGVEVLERKRFEYQNGDLTISEMVVVMRFPSRATINAVFDTPEYEAAKVYRDLAFSYNSLTIVE